MSDKFKKICMGIWAGITAVGGLIIALFLRSNSDRHGSNGADERDTAIKDGLDSSSRGVADCKEHLQRAEDILRGAVDRSKKGE